MTHKEWTAILAWPGYRVYQHELNEEEKTLKLWVRRKPLHQAFECSGCGRRRHAVQDVREREIRDLPWSVYKVTVVVEVHRLQCPECGVKGERIPYGPKLKCGGCNMLRADPGFRFQTYSTALA